jgi:large subunit ribosomal protein L14e
MMDVGRVCIKIAGRDAGETAVVIEKIDDNFVLVNGNVRRKRCNIKHLEPTERFVAIQAGASTQDLHKAMKDAGLEVKEKSEKTKEAKPKTENPKTAKGKDAKAETKPAKEKASKKVK